MVIGEFPSALRPLAFHSLRLCHSIVVIAINSYAKMTSDAVRFVSIDVNLGTALKAESTRFHPSPLSSYASFALANMP
jgi:hypothetical protein